MGVGEGEGVARRDGVGGISARVGTDAEPDAIADEEVDGESGSNQTAGAGRMGASIGACAGEGGGGGEEEGGGGGSMASFPLRT